MKIPHLFLQSKARFATKDFDPEQDWVRRRMVAISRLRDGVAILGGQDQPLRIRLLPGKGRMPNGSILIETQGKKRLAWTPLRDSDAQEREWLEFLGGSRLRYGTFELCGPGIKENAERLGSLRLFKHGTERLSVPIISHEGIENYLRRFPMKGIVFHDLGKPGIRAKVLRREFGLTWPAQEKVIAR